MGRAVGVEWAERDRRRLVAAVVAVAVAAVAVISGSLPPAWGRMPALIGLTAVGVPRTAAGVTVLAGFALLVVARGLRRGSRLAWALALGLLAALVVLHLLKGIDVEESVITGAALAWLARQRSSFPVLPSRATAVRAAVLAATGAAAAVAVSAALTAWSVARLHRWGTGPLAAARRAGAHLPLWFDPDPIRLARPVMPVLAVGLVGAALWLLLAPRRPVALSGEDHHAQRERAREVVACWGRDSLAYFALRDDKDWFFAGSSVVAYSVRGDVCLVSPDPIGPAEEADSVWAQFRAWAERSGWSVLVVGASAEHVPHYRASGMRAVYLGDEAVLDAQAFTLAGRAMRGLRQASNRVERAGITISFHRGDQLDDQVRAELAALAGDSRRGHVERGFSMTLGRVADPSDGELLLTIARDEGCRVVGFLQWVPAPGLPGWSLDVMRRAVDPELPNGITDHMIVSTAAHLKDEGGGMLALNFAVLKTVVAGEVSGRWAHLATQAVSRLGSRSQMQSLWRFNAKFDPTWRPRYLVVDAVSQLAGDALALAHAEGLTGSLGQVPLVARLLPGPRRTAEHHSAALKVGQAR